MHLLDSQHYHCLTPFPVFRNVVTSVTPTKSKLHEEVYAFARQLDERLLPRTTAYHEIWLDKKLVAGNAVHDFEPLYGPCYLPRKVVSFKAEIIPVIDY